MRSCEELTVPIESGAATTALVYRADKSAGPTFILAHGAGAGQRSSFMVDFARALSSHGLQVVTFNFPYTEQGRRLPDRGPLLEACYRAVIALVRTRLADPGDVVVIGGKSMGGRIATQVAAANPAVPVDGLVLLGYPLHPPGRPAQRRDAHLPSVRRPMLFVQGSRDAFGTPAEFSELLDMLSPPATFHVVEGGDHSFKLSGTDRGRQAAIYENVQQTIVSWIKGLAREGTTSPRG